MKYERMPYHNTRAEYEEILSFLNAEEPTNDMQLWDAGIMNFWRNSTHGRKEDSDPFFSDNVQVFKENGAIVAVCISEYGEDDIFFEMKKGYEDAAEDILSWIDDIWSTGKRQIRIYSYNDDSNKVELLTKNGYSFNQYYGNKRYYDLDQLNLGYSLADGYRMVAFDEHPDYESRVRVVHSAFNNHQYSEANLKSLQSSGDYIPSLHLGILSPEGNYVAYCIGWRSPSNPSCGYIEPVGTHKEFRRLGFATAIIKENFRRMKELGIHVVTIESHPEPDISNFLYDSLKPFRLRKVAEYRKVL